MCVRESMCRFVDVMQFHLHSYIFLFFVLASVSFFLFQLAYLSFACKGVFFQDSLINAVKTTPVASVPLHNDKDNNIIKYTTQMLNKQQPVCLRRVIISSYSIHYFSFTLHGCMRYTLVVFFFLCSLVTWVRSQLARCL